MVSLSCPLLQSEFEQVSQVILSYRSHMLWIIVNPLTLHSAFLSVSPDIFWKVVGRNLSTWGCTFVEYCGVMVMQHSIIRLTYQWMHMSSILKSAISFCPKGLSTGCHYCRCIAVQGGVGCKCCFSFLASIRWIFLDTYSFLLTSVCVFLKNTIKGCNSVPTERVFLYWVILDSPQFSFVFSLTGDQPQDPVHAR